MVLDSKYEKADLNRVMTEKCQHLSTKERYILLTLLLRFEDLFNVPLGNCNTTQVDLELKYVAKPVCFQPYPVPGAHEDMFKN